MNGLRCRKIGLTEAGRRAREIMYRAERARRESAEREAERCRMRLTDDEFLAMPISERLEMIGCVHCDNVRIKTRPDGTFTITRAFEGNTYSDNK